ncbi:anaphase-promoting complex, cyclosome, subunit 4-domain-containing protein [Umbelopsis sp. PMI_123]|nr:anaphase-promoting complex, cyclosome, subunit 4-domain-containing protein [Umbelopsis sp. PMI_123]
MLDCGQPTNFPYTFPQYEEKLLTDDTDVCITLWCPIADLLAIAHKGGSLSICRNGVHTVWSWLGDADILAMAWRPDGKELAVGLESGLVRVFNMALPHPSSTIVWRTISQGISVSSLNWNEYDSFASKEELPFGIDPSVLSPNHILPEISSLITAPSELGIDAKNIGEGELDSDLPDETHQINILTICDSEGNIHFCASGRYFASSIPLLTHGLQDAVVLQSVVSSDLQSMSLMVKARIVGTSTATTIDQDAETLCWVIIDTRVLNQRASQLANIAQKSFHIRACLKYISICNDALAKQYRGIAGLSSSNLKKFEQVLLDHDESNATPIVEFLGLLATGMTSQPLHYYLEQVLTEQQIRKWEKEANAGFQSMLRIICEYIQPACDRLLCLLNDLNAYSRWKENYDDLISEGLTCTSISLVGAFHGRYQELIAGLKKTSESFQEFIAWARYMVQHVVDPGSTGRSACSRPLLIVDFLENSLISDRIANFFVMNEPASFEPFLPTVNFGDQPYLPPAYPFHFKLPLSLPSDVPRPTLFEFLEKLNQTVEDLFASPAQSLQRHLKVVKCFPLCPYEGVEHQAKSQLYGSINRNTTVRIVTENTTHQQYAGFVIVEKGRRKLYMLNLAMQFESATLAVGDIKVARFDVQDVIVSEMEMFDDRELGMILVDPTDGRTYIATISYPEIEYSNVDVETVRATSATRATENLVLNRYMELKDMENVILGTNGRQRRRILSVVDDSGKILVLEMDEGEPDIDEDGDDD